MARMTFVEGVTIAVSWAIVTPANILIKSFPSKASFKPGSDKIVCANWGLQLSGTISFVKWSTAQEESERTIESLRLTPALPAHFPQRQLLHQGWIHPMRRRHL